MPAARPSGKVPAKSEGEHPNFMKHTFVMAGLVAAALTFVPATQAFAQAAAAAPAAAPTGPVKIGTLNFQACVAASNEGARDFGDLQKKYQPKGAALEAQNTEIQNLQKQLQANGEKLSDDERASRARTIETKQKELQRTSEDTQKEYQDEQQQIFVRIAKKVEDYINDYATQNGYSLILESGAQSSPIVFQNPGIDLTRTIVAGYNTKSGVPAPPAAPASTPATRKPATPARPGAK